MTRSAFAPFSLFSHFPSRQQTSDSSRLPHGHALSHETSDRFRKALRDNNIKLVTWRQLAALLQK